MSLEHFSGTDGYIASTELQEAVNIAIALERPLLLKGEPGTGKTLLAESVAHALGRPLTLGMLKAQVRLRKGSTFTTLFNVFTTVDSVTRTSQTFANTFDLVRLAQHSPARAIPLCSLMKSIKRMLSFPTTYSMSLIK